MGLFSSKSRTSDSPDSIDDSQLEEYLTEGLSNYKPGANDSKPTQNFYVNDKAVLKTQGYDLFKTIGCGAYAVVKRGFSNRMERAVAVKIINENRIPDEVKKKFLPRELRVSLMVKHPNIVQCYEIFKARHMLYMILENVGHGDLLNHLTVNDVIEENEAKKMFYSIASAVRYLHDNHIVHRDLKLENILLGRNLVPKISDFGFARHSNPTELCETFCGSEAYAPLEVLCGIPYNAFKVDAWCLGVILYAMTVGFMPFTELNHKNDIKRGVHFRETKQPISSQLKSLIKRVLAPDAKDRLSIERIIFHKWVQGNENEAQSTW